MKNELFTPENITALKENEIFVFGSNLNGNHAGGAARVAVEKFGAIDGQAVGLQGQSYAIPTLDKDMQKLKLGEIKKYVLDFFKFAEENPNLYFYVTKIGCGIAGFTIKNIQSIFISLINPGNVILPEEFSTKEQVINGYKAFDKDMTCRNKQYEIGKEYTENKLKLCEKGIHFCKNPFDVLSYYPLLQNDCSFTNITKVKSLGENDTDGIKYVTKHIRIGVKLSLSNFIKSGVDFLYEKCIKEMPDCIVGSSGYAAKIGSSGNVVQIGSSGNAAMIGSSGDVAKIGSSGDAAKIGSSGDAAQIGSSGDYAKIGSSGDYAKIGSSGDYAVISAIGKDSEIKAKKGSWITLAEYDIDNKPLYVKSAKIDGIILKEDVFYTLQNGEFIEVEE